MIGLLTSEEMIALALRARKEPCWFVRHLLGQDIWDIQAQILNSIRDNDRTAVSACHSIGKSHITACAIIWFLTSFPYSQVIITAPTWHQVSGVVWQTVRKVFNQSKMPFATAPLVTPKWQIDDGWFCIGLASKEPERLQGYHAPYVLVVVDEASGVEAKMFEALRGILSSGWTRLLMLGNPTRSDGGFHEAFHGKRDLYKDGLFSVSAWDTPNFASIKHWRPVEGETGVNPERVAVLRATPPIRTYLITPQAVADMEEEFGVDSDSYRVRVLGLFPKGTNNELISIGLIEAAAERWEEMHSGQNRIIPWWECLPQIDVSRVVEAGLDVARYGKNESVLACRLEDVLAPLKCWQGIDTVDMAGMAKEQLIAHRAKVLRVDEPGVGGPVLDNMKRWDIPGFTLMGYNGGSEAVNKELYLNLRAEAFFGLQERFKQGRIAIPRDQRLMSQLASVRYKYRPSGQRQIESKDEAEARGVKSPDKADAVAQAFASIAGGGPCQVVVPPARTRWSGMYGS